MTMTLEANHVTKRYGGVVAVDDASVVAKAGAITGLMGPNGAGKTTLFNAMTCVSPPSEGKVILDGRDLTGLGMAEFSRLPVGRTFQTPRQFESLSVLENVLGMTRARGETLASCLFRRRVATEEIAAGYETLAEVGLESMASRSVNALSGGERRLLEIARQLARRPRLLLLDEPTAGLDKVGQRRLAELLERMNAAGLTILLVEHNISFLFRVSSVVYVMASGRIAAVGSPAEVAADPAVMESYLGRPA